MLNTPVSLLYRLRDQGEVEAWPKFVDLYTPLLYRWAYQLGHQDADAADLVQDVFTTLWQTLPEFRYDANKSFHAWLKTTFLNRNRSRLRKKFPQTNGTDIELPRLEKMQPGFDEADLHFLIRQAFRNIEAEFSQMHREVFKQYVLEYGDPDLIARNFNINPGTVYTIKSKIMSRLRQALQDLGD